MSADESDLDLDLTDYAEPGAEAVETALRDEHAEVDAAWRLVLADAMRESPAESVDMLTQHEDPDLLSMNLDQREAWASDPDLTRAEHTRRLGLVIALEGDAPPRPKAVSNLFVDLAALDDTEAVKTALAMRADGVGLMYAGAVNVMLGDPEQGKSLIAAAVAVEVARSGGVVVWLDLDHNGAHAFKSRLTALGADDAAVLNIRFAQPEDREEVDRIVRWTAEQHGSPVTLFVVDSIGELLPMFGASSDSADDYTRVNRQVLAAVARVGAGVLAIDHLAKNAESRAYGSTGTIAKKRTVDGSMFRVEATKPFAPGKGGEARLRLLKDRHGWVRAHSPEGREPVVARFVLEPDTTGGPGSWAMQEAGAAMTVSPLDADVIIIAALTPPPSGYRDVKLRLGWRDDRAQAAMREWKSRRIT